MGKRFTETSKWESDWFMDLTDKMKLAWLFLNDNCNHAGIWEIKIKLINFVTGHSHSIEEMQESFKGKVILIDEDHLFIPGFIKLQYGRLKETNNAHISAIKILRDFSLIDSDNNLIPLNSVISQGASQQLRRGWAGDQEKKRKEKKRNEKEKEKEKGAPEKTANPDIVLELWNQMAKENPMPPVKVLNPQRKTRTNKCIKDIPKIEDWEKLISQVPKDNFRSGDNNRNWVANFDWLVNTNGNHLKLLEECENKQPDEALKLINFIDNSTRNQEVGASENNTINQ